LNKHKNIPPLVSFTSNKPIVIYIRVQDSFKKFITRANMSTSPLVDIQRSKLLIIKRFGSICKGENTPQGGHFK
jgi:hypothetical protein